MFKCQQKLVLSVGFMRMKSSLDRATPWRLPSALVNLERFWHVFFTVLCTQQEKGHQTWHEINWRLWMENCEPQDLEKMYVNRRAATNSVYGCVVHERKLNSLSKWKHPPPQNPTFVLAQILVDTYWNNGFWFWGAFLVPQGGSI